MNRVSVLGILITPTNLDKTVKFLKEYNFIQPAYICLPDTSVVARASKDEKLMQILDHSLLSLPDGEPLVMILKLRGYKDVSTISGYWLIKSMMKSNLTHFFYGATEATCKQLTENLLSESPGCRILGYKSPPFENLSNIENNNIIMEDIAAIKLLRPDIVWVGISSPKQDYLMFHYHRYLENSVMIGVGGVFDYLAGTHKISPEWIKKIGLRWLYRFLQDPGRLWKKYYDSFSFMIRYFLTNLLQKINVRKRSANPVDS
jgi:N-acetylglucosaminyldiphosphoundecaprenol N-acetyl-beta-D-mannosaminyltransferase